VKGEKEHMSFIQNATGRGYAPGWFLASADCKRETVEVSASHSQVVTLSDGSKIVPAGAVIPSNDAYAKGILYEDVEVTTGDMPGSIVTKGVIYEDRLPASLDSDAKTALTGITVISAAPAVIRPDFSIDGLKALTIVSAAGTAAGDTALTVTGYTLKSGESWGYKVGDAAATVLPGEVVTGWTAWDGDDDITAATGKKLALVALNAAGQAIAYGNVTVTAKA
jgi:hypothetical protein